MLTILRDMVNIHEEAITRNCEFNCSSPLELQFLADQITTGSSEDQARATVRLINDVLQREPYGLGAKIQVPSGVIGVTELAQPKEDEGGEGTDTPTDVDLAKIEAWPVWDMAGLLEFVRNIWSDYGRIWREGSNIHLATGGWSGNEMIVGALKRTVFWSMCWERSERGGKHVFCLPPDWREQALSAKSS
jgi:hypothetical protein